MPIRTTSVAGDRITILLDGKDTQGAYSVMEITLPPGGGTPPHIHHREDEAFMLVAGEVTFYCGGEVIVRRAGEYLLGPRDVPHHYTNTGDTDAIMIMTATPAGVEDFFESVGTALPSRTAPPVPLTPEGIGRIVAQAPQYGIEILPPPSA